MHIIPDTGLAIENTFTVSDLQRIRDVYAQLAMLEGLSTSPELQAISSNLDMLNAFPIGTVSQVNSNTALYQNVLSNLGVLQSVLSNDVKYDAIVGLSDEINSILSLGSTLTTIANSIDGGVFKGAKGDKGDIGNTGNTGLTGAKGNSGTLAIGTVTTLPSTSTATVINVGTVTDAVLNIAIPRGELGLTGLTGKDGKTPTFIKTSNTSYDLSLGNKTFHFVNDYELLGLGVGSTIKVFNSVGNYAIGTVTNITVTYMDVVITSVEGAGIFDEWTISLVGERGEKGDQGIQGIQGVQGVKGDIGSQGLKGDTGLNGWSPVFAVVMDGSREVFKVTDWQGGAGTKPAINVYMGATGYTYIIADAVNIKGNTGAQGIQGIAGAKGDTGNQGAQGIQGLKGDTGVQGIQGATGATGQGVPTGGTTGQLLTKTSATDYATAWQNAPSGLPSATANQIPVYNGTGWVSTSNAHISKLGTSTTSVNIGGLSNNTTHTGSYAISEGISAGRSSTTGANWVAQGYAAGYSNTTGSSWVAQGYIAGYSNTTGSGWIAQGNNAGFSNTTGSNWVAQGVNAGYSNTTGSNWVAQGINAGRYVGSGTTPLTVANSTVYIGSHSRAGADNVTNEVVIGANAIGNGSNTVTLGSSAITGTYIRNLRPVDNVYDSSGSAGVAGQVMTRGASGVEWKTNMVGKYSELTASIPNRTVGTETIYSLSMTSNNSLGGSVSSGQFNVPLTGTYMINIGARPIIRNIDGGVYGMVANRIYKSTGELIGETEGNMPVNVDIGLITGGVLAGVTLTAGQLYQFKLEHYAGSSGSLDAHTVTIKFIYLGG